VGVGHVMPPPPPAMRRVGEINHQNPPPPPPPPPPPCRPRCSARDATAAAAVYSERNHALSAWPAPRPRRPLPVSHLRVPCHCPCRGGSAARGGQRRRSVRVHGRMPALCRRRARAQVTPPALLDTFHSFDSLVLQPFFQDAVHFPRILLLCDQRPVNPRRLAAAAFRCPAALCCLPRRVFLDACLDPFAAA
jgi:hypothetical protein